MGDSKQNIINGLIKPRITEKDEFRYSNKNEMQKYQKFDEQIENLINKLEHSPLTVNRLLWEFNTFRSILFCSILCYIGFLWMWSFR